MLPKNITRLSNVRYRKENQGIKTVGAVFIASYDKPAAVRIRIQGEEHLVGSEEVLPEREWEKHVLLDEYGRVFELWAAGQTNCAEIARQMTGVTAPTIRRVVKKGIKLQIIAPKPAKK